MKRTVISSHLVHFDAHFMHVWIGCVIRSVFMLNRQINGLKVQNNQTLNTATQEAGTFKIFDNSRLILLIFQYKMITEIMKHCLTTSFKMEDMRQIEIFICTFSIHIYVNFSVFIYTREVFNGALDIFDSSL